MFSVLIAARDFSSLSATMTISFQQNRNYSKWMSKSLQFHLKCIKTMKTENCATNWCNKREKSTTNHSIVLGEWRNEIVEMESRKKDWQLCIKCSTWMTVSFFKFNLKLQLRWPFPWKQFCVPRANEKAKVKGLWIEKNFWEGLREISLTVRLVGRPRDVEQSSELQDLNDS